MYTDIQDEVVTANGCDCHMKAQQSSFVLLREVYTFMEPYFEGCIRGSKRVMERDLSFLCV